MRIQTRGSCRRSSSPWYRSFDCRLACSACWSRSQVTYHLRQLSIVTALVLCLKCTLHSQALWYVAADEGDRSVVTESFDKQAVLLAGSKDSFARHATCRQLRGKMIRGREASRIRTCQCCFDICHPPPVSRKLMPLQSKTYIPLTRSIISHIRCASDSTV